jgi:transposase
LTSGRVEALNPHVRLISRRAHGFHSANALDTMTYLCSADIHIDLPHQ